MIGRAYEGGRFGNETALLNSLAGAVQMIFPFFHGNGDIPVFSYFFFFFFTRNFLNPFPSLPIYLFIYLFLIVVWDFFFFLRETGQLILLRKRQIHLLHFKTIE